MKKLPVAGPTYDYKLENIRNDIIEQELALCLKRQEDLATNSTIVDGDGNTTTLRANLDTEFYTRTEADTAIASATTSLVSETALNTALGDYTNTATLEQNFYTKTDADSAIASATLNLVSTSDLATELGNYTTTASLEQNYYTEAEADSAISSAITTNNVTIGNTYATISTVSAVSGDVDGIQGKYAVKIDNNGHVSGFGLVSEANNAAIAGDGISGAATTSTFTIAADAFKIVDTSGAATPTSPFEVYTSSRTVDGVTVPAGVYMENANITAANIKTLDVDVINLDGVTLDTSGGELVVKNGGVNTTQIATNAVTKGASAQIATTYNYDWASYGGSNSGSNLALSLTTTRTGQRAIIRFIFKTSILTSWSGGLTGGGTGTRTDTAGIDYQFAIRKIVNGTPQILGYIPVSYFHRGMSQYTNVYEFEDTLSGTVVYQPYIASFNVSNGATHLRVHDQMGEVLEVKR
jgi:hypothetical protein